MRLAIHTASTLETVCLLEKDRVIAEHFWKGARDESEKLLLAIDKVLKRAKKSFTELESIVVVKGPGPFSAVRIGVTVANVLGFSLQIPVMGFSTLDLWRARLPKGKHDGAVLILFAGGHFVALQKDSASPTVLVPIEEVRAQITAWKIQPNKHLEFFGDLTENSAALFHKEALPTWKFLAETELVSIGGACAGLAKSAFTKETPITPLYFKPPHITLPSHVLQS